jgi:hypothetical protein
VTLIWIPSHTEIPGNDTVDNLASTECSSPTGNRIGNNLSAAEQLGIFRSDWTEAWLHRLKSCRKPTVQIRTQIRRIEWHFSPDRQASICLHGLRSGHNYLNAFLHRIDEEADHSCRKGCEALENPSHILLECPSFEEQRRKVRTLFPANGLTLDLNTLIGLKPDVPRTTQFKIRNALVQVWT